MRRRFLAILLLVLLMLSSCNQIAFGNRQEDESSEIVLASDPVESYDNESVFVPEGSEASEEADNGGFVSKDKMYTYGENNIVLLNVENKTDKNYTLTVNGFYLDKDGNVLGTETQTAKDFVSGYQRYFLFHPEMAFESFSYTFSYVEFDGETRLSNIKQLKWDFETANYQVWYSPTSDAATDFVYELYSKWSMINESDTNLFVRGVTVAIDGNGEVLSLGLCGYQEYPAGTSIEGSTELYHSPEKFTVDKKTWPENLQKGIQLIMIPLEAMTLEEFRAWEATVRN